MACRGPWVQVPSPPPCALAAAHEDVLPAVFCERLAGEAAVKGLEFQTGHVEESEPLVLRCPPERARLAAVEGEVDSIVADGVANGVGHGLVLVLAVVRGRD